jgi:hypothetical protein
MSAQTPATGAAAATTPAGDKPLDKLNARLPDILAATGHPEMWGVELQGAGHVPTQVVLQKFLRANAGDVAAAEKQLRDALAWRKETQPLALVEAAYDKAKFADLGFVTVHKGGERETVFTWNIYGSVKDNKATFGDVKEFIRWRVALMEMGMQKLNLNAITELIPEGGEDPYQMYQVHDYKSLFFFRMDPAIKPATTETIKVLGMAYPETLADKYFVNVPAVMGWVYAAMKLVLSPATLKKFHPMSDGMSLAAEKPAIADSLPAEYGGKGPSVKEGMTVKLVDAAELKKEPAAEAKPTEAPAEKAVEPKADAQPAENKIAEEVKPAPEPVAAIEPLPVVAEKPVEANAAPVSESEAETEVKPTAVIEPLPVVAEKPVEASAAPISESKTESSPKEPEQKAAA